MRIMFSEAPEPTVAVQSDVSVGNQLISIDSSLDDGSASAGSSTPVDVVLPLPALIDLPFSGCLYTWVNKHEFLLLHCYQCV